MMLHTKYEGSRPCGFRQDFFMVFPIQAYVKHVNPVASQFWHERYNLNKLGRGSLDDATTRHRALWFQTRRFFHGFPYISLCKQCGPVAGPFLAIGT